MSESDKKQSESALWGWCVFIVRTLFLWSVVYFVLAFIAYFDSAPDDRVQNFLNSIKGFFRFFS
jgi:hypothetical protein